MFKILLPTDFSKNSKEAIDFVFKHFKKSEVDLLLVHIIKAPHSAAGVLIRIDDLMRKDAKVHMEELVEYIGSTYGVVPQSEIKIGHLSDWVKQYSKVLNLDLIAMGTKGESNIGSKLMGSVTESVIRTSKLPVLAIPCDNDSNEMRHIAIATSKEKIDNPEFLVSLMRTLEHQNLRVNTLKVKKSDKELLPKAVAIEGYQVGVESVTNTDVVDGINKYLHEVKTDLLVLYHKKNSRMDYFFNRSITKTIAGKTCVPLLVIPDKSRT